MKNETYREELTGILETLKESGYKTYIHKNNCYGYIITPSDNIMYIQRDSFEWRGWTFSLQYVPDQKTGSGCQCLEEPVNTVTSDTIAQAEKEGLAFARRLGAKLYNGSASWLRKYWDKDNLIEI
jgi:hypothetical protein